MALSSWDPLHLEPVIFRLEGFLNCFYCFRLRPRCWPWQTGRSIGQCSTLHFSDLVGVCVHACAAESYVYTTYAYRYIFIGMLVSEGMRVTRITVCKASTVCSSAFGGPCCPLKAGRVTISNDAVLAVFSHWNGTGCCQPSFASENKKTQSSFWQLQTVIQCPVYIESAALLLLACLGAIGDLYYIYILESFLMVPLFCH